MVEFVERPGTSRWAAVLVFGGLFTLALLPPFVGAEVGKVIVEMFAPVCHQMPERSYVVYGTPLAVGQRCIGIYGGLAVGALIYPLAVRWKDVIGSYSRIIVLAALLPAGLEWTGEFVGWWVGLPVLRTLTGAAVGLGAAYFVSGALTQMADQLLRRLENVFVTPQN